MVFAGPPTAVDWWMCPRVRPSSSLAPGDVARRHHVISRGVILTAAIDVSVRKATHRALHDAAQAVETFRFNVAVARVMELVNVLRKAIDSGPGSDDPAVREGAEAVAIMVSLVAPYAAEDMWARLRRIEPSVARAGWPDVGVRVLLVDIGLRHHLRGSSRRQGQDRLDVSPSIQEDELLSDLALASKIGYRHPSTVGR